MFTSARFKLTGWYLLIILVMTGTLSGLFYLRTSYVLEQEFRRIEQRFLRNGYYTPSISLQLQIVAEDLDNTRRQILLQILSINGLIAVFFGVAGFILSGKTLQPIKETMQEQKRFIADAAHELRTPLTALKTSLEVNLMDESLSKKSRVILQENLEDVTSLEQLTNSLLRLSRLEDHRSHFESVFISDTLTKAIKHVKPLANKKSITFEQSVPKDLIISGDPGALLDLCIIFLDNAIKYSHPKSTVGVTACTRRSEIQLEISDSGVGISKEHVEHIFDRFYRVDQARSKLDSGGYGLGLAVAQKIMTQHQGSISVRSELGKGTTFTLRFPKKISHT